MLSPRPLPPVPGDIAWIARAAFPEGHPSLAEADAPGEVFTGDTFAALFLRRSQSALAPWWLALATVLQFAEGRSDRQAADAGFDTSALVEFRGTSSRERRTGCSSRWC